MPLMSVNGIDVNYVDEGKGDVLVLIHNLISSIHGYDFSLPVFAKHFRTIAYDQRGHGASSKPEGGYTFDNMSEDLYQLLKALGVNSCYLLGTAAIGVGVLFTFFDKHPEMVKALIPVGGTGSSLRPAEQTPAQASPRGLAGFQHLQDVARQGGMMAVLEERKQTMTFWTEKILTDPEIWNRFEQMYRETALQAFLALPERITPEKWLEIQAQLQKHKPPMMELVGVEDGDPMVTVRNMKYLYPACHAVIVPDAGHYPAVENPQDFNAAVLHFLAGVKAYA